MACFENDTRDMMKRKWEPIVEDQVVIGCLEEGHCARSASAEKDPMLSPRPLFIFREVLEYGATNFEL